MLGEGCTKVETTAYSTTASWTKTTKSLWTGACRTRLFQEWNIWLNMLNVAYLSAFGSAVLLYYFSVRCLDKCWHDNLNHKYPVHSARRQHSIIDLSARFCVQWNLTGSGAHDRGTHGKSGATSTCCSACVLIHCSLTNCVQHVCARARVMCKPTNCHPFKTWTHNSCTWIPRLMAEWLKSGLTPHHPQGTFNIIYANFSNINNCPSSNCTTTNCLN